MLLPHFDDHPPLPMPKIILVKLQDYKGNTYNVCLDCMKMVFEHRRIFLVKNLAISLPFRHAFFKMMF
jgi:hypothetical protein